MVKELYKFSLRRLQGTAGEFQLLERWDTIPNAITVVGMVGILFYAWLFATNSVTWLIPLVHIGILATDALDGIVADKLNQHSRPGKYLDPVRDRMHAGALFANFMVVSAETALIIALAIAILAEMWIAVLAVRGMVRNAHSVGKVRAMVYAVCGLVALVQVYWIEEETVAYLTTLASIMAAASIGAATFYTHHTYARNAGGAEKRP